MALGVALGLATIVLSSCAKVAGDALLYDPGARGEVRIAASPSVCSVRSVSAGRSASPRDAYRALPAASLAALWAACCRASSGRRLLLSDAGPGVTVLVTEGPRIRRGAALGPVSRPGASVGACPSCIVPQARLVGRCYSATRSPVRRPPQTLTKKSIGFRYAQCGEYPPGDFRQRPAAPCLHGNLYACKKTLRPTGPPRDAHAAPSRCRAWRSAGCAGTWGQPVLVSMQRRFAEGQRVDGQGQRRVTTGQA